MAKGGAIAKETQTQEDPQISLLTRRVQELEETESLLEEERDALKKQLEAQTASQGELEAAKAESESSATRLEEERSRTQTLLRDLEKLGVERANLASEVALLKEERSRLLEDLGGANNAAEALRTQAQDLSERLRHQQEVNDRLQKGPAPPDPSRDFIASLEAELKQERAQLASLRDTVRGLLQKEVGATAGHGEEALETLLKEGRDLRLRAEDAEAEIAQLRLDLKEGDEDLKRRGEDLRVKEDRIKTLTKELAEAKDTIE